MHCFLVSTMSRPKNTSCLIPDRQRVILIIISIRACMILEEPNLAQVLKRIGTRLPKDPVLV